MSKTFKKPTQQETDQFNRMQQLRFDKLFHLFEPPLPEGVPERLERIVAEGKIKKKDIVLDVGSGTGILIPIIRKYGPSRIYACDLSEKMLAQLHQNHPDIETFQTDIKDLSLPNSLLDVVFINACYPNIVDKQRTFENVARMMKTNGRMVISHPLGKAFIKKLRRHSPYPLDEFPDRPEMAALFRPFGFRIRKFIDEPELYIITLGKDFIGV